MKTYEVHFRWNGKVYKEHIATNYAFKARELIKGRYPGCVITTVKEILG